MPPQQVAAFVIDWDETISASDTLSKLAQCAPAVAERWPEFTQKYLDDLASFQKEWETQHGLRDTVEKQMQFLGDLEQVEKKSVARIESSKVFEGVTHEDVAGAAEQAPLRAGFEAFAQAAGHCHILSVHWSAHFIRTALSDACKDWTIAANELDFVDGRCTGRVSKSGTEAFRTGIDKQRWLRQFRKKQEGVIVYIGDSNTDLPALLEADIGILFGGNKSLASTCERLGLNVQDLSAYKGDVQGLYRTSDWKEIHALLL